MRERERKKDRDSKKEKEKEMGVITYSYAKAGCHHTNLGSLCERKLVYVMTWSK